MNKMNEERKLIFEDQGLIPLLEKDLRHFWPHLDKLKVSFDALELEAFSDEIYKELVNKGTTEIKERYQDKIRKEIKSAGITNSLITENLMNGNLENIAKLNKDLDTLKASHPFKSAWETLPNLRIEDISYSEEGFIVSEEDQESLMEKHARVYIQDPEEHELYESLQAFVDAYNDINSTLASSGEDRKNSIEGMVKTFLSRDNDEYIIKAKAINQELNHTAIQAERQRRRFKRSGNH